MSGRPLRVLHIITRMIVGGAQESVLLNCDLVDRGRYASEILTGPQTGAEGSLMDEARTRGIPLHVEPMLVRELHALKDPVAMARLIRFLRRDRFDIVHTHTAKAATLGRIAARVAGVPVVVHTVHGWVFTAEHPAWQSRIYLEIERLLAPLCDALVVVAENDLEEGLSLGVGRPDQYVLIRSGIELGAYRDPSLLRSEARQRLGLPEDAFVVGSIGRLSPPKCPEVAVAAFAQVAVQLPSAHLVIVGDGWQRAGVEVEIGRLGLASRVHMLGLRMDVPQLLRAFDVFLLTSSHEGLPRTIPQAMAAGLPVVATRVGGVPNAVVEGETGWLTSPGDAGAMAERVLALARDPEAARSMGDAGRARVDEFSADRMARQLEQLYDRLVRDRLPRP
jgi:glycosyltransferase involved in cell wall biosynthesis